MSRVHERAFVIGDDVTVVVEQCEEVEDNGPSRFPQAPGIYSRAETDEATAGEAWAISQAYARAAALVEAIARSETP